jgi:hypothetical protein
MRPLTAAQVPCSASSKPLASGSLGYFGADHLYHVHCRREARKLAFTEGRTGAREGQNRASEATPDTRRLIDETKQLLR